MRQVERQWHIGFGLVGGIAKHHTLVASALLFFVGTAHATVNVAALLVNGGKDTTRLAVEFILRLGVANLFDGAASDGLQVDVCL